jgi:hypothetical protein
MFLSENLLDPLNTDGKFNVDLDPKNCLALAG